MPSHGDKRDGFPGMNGVHNSDGRGSPAGDENLLRLFRAWRCPGHNVIGIYEMPRMTVGQINTRQVAVGAKSPNDSEGVAKIVGEKKSIAVGAEGHSQWVNRLFTAIVPRRRSFG